MRPVLVLGVGRCGTSAVARALHEEGGVHMGDDLETDPTRACPEGSYEDREVRTLHRRYLAGTISRELLEARLDTLVARRELRGRTWGVKDPRMCHVARSWFERVSAARVVVCERALGRVLDSWDRVISGSRTAHRREIRARALALNYGIAATREIRSGPLVRLDMNERRSTSWILERVLTGRS